MIAFPTNLGGRWRGRGNSKVTSDVVDDDIVRETREPYNMTLQYWRRDLVAVLRGLWESGFSCFSASGHGPIS